MENEKAVILIVDDTPANIYALERLLEDKDRIVLTASSGKDALHTSLNTNIDLIILDVQMPEMDGFEVAQILKSNKRTKDIPIIFATAVSKEHRFVIKGYEEGAVDYLYKPIDPQIVKAKVAVLLKLQIQKNELIAKNLALEKSALLINNSADIIGIIDAESLRIEEINNAFTSIVNSPAEEAKGKLLPVFLTSESQELVKHLKEEKKERLSFETGVYYKGTTIKWLQWKVVIKEGKWFVNARDITQIKEADEQIRKMNKYLEERVEEKTKEVIEQEKQYRFLLDNMREGIQVISYDWRYLYVNNAGLIQAKCTASQMLNRTIMEIYPGIENSSLFAVLQKCMHDRTPETVENEFVYPDKTKKWLELSIQPVPEGIFILASDINARKKAEEEIIKSNERFDMAVQATSDAIRDWNLETNELFWGDSYEKLFGHKVADQKGNFDDWLEHLHPEDNKRVIDGIHKSIDNKKKQWEDEYRYRKADNSFAYVLDRCIILYDDVGKAWRMIGAMNDISRIKEAEIQLRQLNEQLEKRAAELEASNVELERFAFVASHDLQEPLRMVSSFLSLLESETKGQLNEDVQEYIRYAVDGAERMKKLIQALLQYSRLGNVKEGMSDVNCNKLMESLRYIFEPAMQEIKATLHVKPLPNVWAIESQLQQLFQNLVSNALKYHNHNQPAVEVGCYDEGDMWKFYVRDNGIGIDQMYYEKIFFIFQRLHDKTEYSGTGIGLAICKKIVEKHGGTIWVESASGKGSTFYFTIPKRKHK